ncbi:MAG: S41 family peptidase [Bacteroidota bacterium]
MKYLLLILLSFTGTIQAQETEIQAPIRNFEKLWDTFSERYANFSEKGVDWQQVYQAYRPLIDSSTTNEELFEVCCRMVQELNDGHVTIDPGFNSEIECGPPYDFQFEGEFPTAQDRMKFAAVLDKTLAAHGFSAPVRIELDEETNFQYRVSDAFGYLRLDEMTEKNTYGKFARSLDQAIGAFQDKEAVIIDLLFNGGGWDHISYVLASRLILKGTEVGHFVRTRQKGKDTYTPMKFKQVKARGKNQYVQPIVILTSDFTASAAEVFLLLMLDLPHVTIVGDTTEGIFSDMYEFKLPNNWEVSLSHQQFFSQKMVNYEGKGIPPDVRVLNTRKDIQRQKDAVMEAAISFLQQGSE